MQIAVILPAAGLSKRFNGGGDPLAQNASLSKIEQELAGQPVFLRSIKLFMKRPGVRQVILAVNPDRVEDFQLRWGDKLAFHAVTLVPGGRAERWETVLKALDAVDPAATHVAIHDAARPLTSHKLIERVLEAAERFRAVIPGLPVSATVKRVVADPDASAQQADPLDALLGGAGKEPVVVKRVVGTIDRSDLVEVQTPQVFAIGLLRRAYQQITSGKLQGKGITDDAGLVEALGEPVHVVEGETTNIKITRPDDLKLAAGYLHVTEAKETAALAKKRLFKDEDE